MKPMKKQLVSNFFYSWLIFMGLIALIVIEQNLTSPWDRITNALWILGVIALIFFMGKCLHNLFKYVTSMRSSKEEQK